MALKDIVVNVLIKLADQAKTEFIAETQKATDEATEPTKAKRNLSEIDSGINQLTRSVYRLRQAFMVVLGGSFIAGFIKSAIESFLEFDKALNQSIAIMGDVSTTMRDKMAATAMELSKELNLSAADIARAYYFLASAGMNAEQSIKAIPIVAAFAKAGLMDMSSAAEKLMQATAAMGYASKDATENMAGMARTSDVLTKASKISQTSIEEIVTALNNKAGAAFRIAGKDVEELAASLDVLAKQGIKGARAGERLSIFLRTIQFAAVRHKEVWQEAGIAIFDHTGKLKNMADIVQQLTDYLGKLSPRAQNVAMQQLGLQRRTIDATKSFLGQADQLREYQQILENAGGTTQKIADNQLKSMSERFGQAQKAVENAKIELGNSFLPTLERLAGTLGDEDGQNSVIGTMHRFSNWVEKNQTMISALVHGALVFLVDALQTVAIAFNSVADVIVILLTTAILPLIGATELALRGLNALAEIGFYLSAIYGSNGMTNFFQKFADNVKGFGDDVSKFRQRMVEAGDLAKDDFMSQDDGSTAGNPKFKSPKDLVSAAFAGAKGKSKQNAGAEGTDDSLEGGDNSKAARKLQSLMNQLNSMVASETDRVDDDMMTRVNKLEAAFHTVFGKKIPDSIQASLDALKALAPGKDIVHSFAEQMRLLKAEDTDTASDRKESEQHWINILDSMRMALPTLDASSKAYATLKQQIAEAEKELQKLYGKDRKIEDDDEKARQQQRLEWLRNIGRFTDQMVTSMTKAWENLFKRIGKGMHDTGQIVKQVGAEMLSSLIGGLGEYALKKAKENALHAGDEFMKGLAAAADPLTAAEAPGHFKAAAGFAAQAVEWSAAAGIGGYEASRIGGMGGSGGASVGANNAKNSSPQNIVNVYVDGVDPRNPRHQQLIGDTTRQYMERSGTQVFTNPGRKP